MFIKKKKNHIKVFLNVCMLVGEPVHQTSASQFDCFPPTKLTPGFSLTPLTAAKPHIHATCLSHYFP